MKGGGAGLLVSWGASLFFHAAFVVVAAAWLAHRTLHVKTELSSETSDVADGERAIMVDLPMFADGVAPASPVSVPKGEPPHPAGGVNLPRPDLGVQGKGGTPFASSPAVNLSNAHESQRLLPDLVNHFDRDQEQRLKTARDRASWEDRRATTHPMELTFLASGKGELAERRLVSLTDPSRGALSAAPAGELGGALGYSVAQDGAAGPPVGASRMGSDKHSPGLGVAQSPPGEQHSAAAAVASGRPAVTQGPVTIPSDVRGRPRDIVDSEQEVATTVRSLVHASTAGGFDGAGLGGTIGGGDPGGGGSAGPGFHGSPLGVGEGDWFDLDTNDPRLLPYFRRIHKKVDPLWANAFPKSALLELKQGTVILDFVIHNDGSVRVLWPPVRPSGIDEFDRNCAEALRRAGPFEPIPRELGRSSLRVRAPFVASNPIVR